MVKKILLILLVILSLFLFACARQVVVEEAPVEAVVVEEPEVLVEEVVEPEKPEICEYNSDCAGNLLCIEGSCGKLADLYNTECENKCSVKEVKVKTSDGESYDLPLGKGSYSSAGALEWKLMVTPEYCKGDNPLVAIRLIKKSTGKSIGEQIITLHQGETSNVITHPTVKSVKFTATLAEIDEVCS
jgi:hypothetical protein